MPLPGRQPLGRTTTVTALLILSTMLATTLSTMLATAAPADAAANRYVRVAPAQLKAKVNVANACATSPKPGHFTCFAQRRTDVAPVPGPSRAERASGFRAQVTPPGLHPEDLTSAYALPSATAGAGQEVFIVDAYNSPTAEADLAVYRAQYGLPPCTTDNGCFRKVNQNGLASPLPANNSGWAAEIALDLDMVSAICPKCRITLVEANDAGINMLTAVARANTMGAKFVSMSWGGDESASATSYDAAYFKSTGVVYAASSGDFGFADGPIYPATSPRVIAVGGTALVRSQTTRGWSETAWSGAGSGCSTREAKPAWQANISACAKRATTDVSAVADPSTGVSVYLTYGGSGWSVYGGTSAAAPIIAATAALAGRPLSGTSAVKAVYSHPSQLNDVTSGSNGSCSPAALCTARPGWDGPTGLGTPKGIGAFRQSRSTTPGAVIGGYWAQRPVTSVINAAAPAR